MKFSYNWLKELSGTEKTPEELAELIMFHAFEVESVEPYPHGLDSVVIGRVESVVPHPDADRLKVTTVVVAEGESARTIVCGAPNVAAGQKVAVALPGAKLNGVEIKESSIRGVASSGMICAEDELGLGSDHEGILVLPEDAPIGVSFADYAGLSDTILDINVLPNRGCDAVSYRGMARETAALEGRGVSFDSDPTTFPYLPGSPVPVAVESDRCRRYLGILFEDIREGSPPLRLKSALLRSGIRPISLAVDITNYSLLQFGQPMHAFDADKVEGGIVVRQAAEGEMLELLDGKTITLSVEDLVIADENRPLALAGVMGGSRSAITTDTKRVFLEVATFDPLSVRKTVARHRLPTDASYRYERNVDTGRVTVAAEEILRLFTDDAGAKAIGMADVTTRPDEPVSVSFSPSVFADMYGTDIVLSEAKTILGHLGIAVAEQGDEWAALVPTFRPDLHDGWDISEEVGRVIGYDRFPAMVPTVPLSSPSRDASGIFARELRSFLAASGWDEIRTYSFYSEADAKRFGADIASRHLRLANPMNPDQALLRVSLLPSALRKAGENLRYFGSFRFFEIGDRYLKGADGKPVEERTVSLVLVAKKGEDGFAELKGALGKLFKFARYDEVSWTPLPDGGAIGLHALFHPTRTATLSIGGVPVGIAGEIEPVSAATYGLRGGVISAQLSFDALRSAFAIPPRFRPLPKFPYSNRDLSITVASDVPVGELTSVICDASTILRDIEVFDIYAKETEKNVAFHLSFGLDDRTIVGTETDTAITDIVEEVGRKFSARLSS